MPIAKKDVSTFLKRKKKVSHRNLFLLPNTDIPCVESLLPGTQSWNTQSFFNLVVFPPEAQETEMFLWWTSHTSFIITHQSYHCLFNICLPVGPWIPIDQLRFSYLLLCLWYRNLAHSFIFNKFILNRVLNKLCCRDDWSHWDLNCRWSN